MCTLCKYKVWVSRSAYVAQSSCYFVLKTRLNIYVFGQTTCIVLLRVFIKLWSCILKSKQGICIWLSEETLSCSISLKMLGTLRKDINPHVHQSIFKLLKISVLLWKCTTKSGPLAHHVMRPSGWNKISAVLISVCMIFVRPFLHCDWTASSWLLLFRLGYVWLKVNYLGSCKQSYCLSTLFVALIMHDLQNLSTKEVNPFVNQYLFSKSSLSFLHDLNNG